MDCCIRLQGDNFKWESMEKHINAGITEKKILSRSFLGNSCVFCVSAIYATESALLFSMIFTFVFPECCKWFCCDWGGGTRKWTWYQYREWTSQKEESQEVMMCCTLHHFMAVTNWAVHFLCKPWNWTFLPLRNDATDMSASVCKNHLTYNTF